MHTHHAEEEKKQNRPANSGSGPAGFSSLGLKKFIVVDIILSSMVAGGKWQSRRRRIENRQTVRQRQDRRFPLRLDSTRDTETHAKREENKKQKNASNIDSEILMLRIQRHASNCLFLQRSNSYQQYLASIPSTTVVSAIAIFDKWHNMSRLLFKTGEAQKATTMLVVRQFAGAIPISVSKCCSCSQCLLTSSSSSQSFVAARRTTSNPSRRGFSSLPHHLARKNNGMVNVFVKSIKVPRPPVVTMVPPFPPPPVNNIMKSKLRNQLKQQGTQESNFTLAMNASRMLDDDAAQSSSSSSSSQHQFSYAGNVSIPIASNLKIVLPGEDVPRGIWPAFRMMVRVANGRIGHSLFPFLS